MKRMQATITLKQLRTNPRHYVDLLNLGYRVSLTDHGKVLAVAEPAINQKHSKKKYPPHTVGAFLEYLQEIRNNPPLKDTLDPNLDTVEAVKKAKREYLEKKYGDQG